MSARPERRPVGRPTAGARAGEKVKDYPQLSVRVPPRIKECVAALSRVRSTSQWHIITDAIECYFRDLTSEEQVADARLVRQGHRTKLVTTSARRSPRRRG
jgi:hypothetical protein